ncbi:ring-cleaving dioxygenase [Niabella terrae]
MDKQILGLHHITAIAGNARINFDFYTKVIGLRLVKKTVNFDDPGTYHFYFGDETGSPGTLLTFFPWEGIGPGRNGPGMATEIAWSVPAASLNFWEKRLGQAGVISEPPTQRFGDAVLRFTDPDGLRLALVEAPASDTRQGWTGGGVEAAYAIKGFQGTTLTLREPGPTAKILTDILGYHASATEQGRSRFITDAVATAAVIDILTDPDAPVGHNAAGTNHHIAFRVADDASQLYYREKILAAGMQITPQIDRDYFHSLYFREPGGVLFEIATDTPGFTVDEPLAELGQHLKLPQQYEAARAQIESLLPALQ